MTPLAVTAWETITPAGLGDDAALELLEGGSAASDSLPGREGRWEPAPACGVSFLGDFDVRDHVGRKGTTFYDRWTSFAVVACGRALARRGLIVDERNRDRIGLVLGTTVGGFQSTLEFSMDTLTQPRPYLVNAALFPNTVMNCAAGQSAIRHGLRGANVTVGGAEVAFLHALRYAGRLLRSRSVDVMLVGAFEEATPSSAWASHLREPPRATPAGEGGAVFVVERSDELLPGGVPRAEVLSVRAGFVPSGGQPRRIAAGLERCAKRALADAGLAPQEVALVALADASDEGPGPGWLEDAEPERSIDRASFGDCGAACSALQLAALLALHESQAGRFRASLLAATNREGSVAAAAVLLLSPWRS